MNTSRTGQLIAGAGGALLILSLFLPWAEGGRNEVNGWELLTTMDIYLFIVGVAAILAVITGGRIGVFRADVSLNGAVDLLAVVATILLIHFLAFDFPEEADREIGAWLALLASITIAAGAGDYSVLRGAPLFPRLDK